MMEESVVSPERCATIRREYSQQTGFDPLVEELDIEKQELRHHLYGDCSHDIAIEPIDPPVSHQLDADQCQEIRNLFADGFDTETLEQRFETRWRPIARHLTGECSHNNDAPTVARSEISDREPISETDCAVLRERFFDDEERSIMDVARDVRWSYEAVVQHVNGNCSHDITTSSRSTEERGGNLTKEDCQNVRELWAQDPEMTLEKVASEIERSEATVEKHIKRACSHSSDELLIDEMQIFDSILTDEDEQVSDSQAILDAANSSNIDSEEFVDDVITPDSVETTISRTVRNTTLVKELKGAYDYECQVCDSPRYQGPDKRYAEGHHIKPLGEPHNGPDTPSNILVLCPNHHADFDYGLIEIDPGTYEIHHEYDDTVHGSTLTVDGEHDLDPEKLSYHSQRISEVTR
ncbi:HNH endonuclease [Halorhabdus utahensis DSM 12940]|uniref:HNH endonuclease n=1 Tax=Halorhabdus utahensis (strain DSM 12940 / JCM 11049 / AX-2) TaxID=519442 RepID=C7NQZ2_HALUD|nr:HNH endonuclease [Halorhabdus utahensis]ACV11896.1 HNH endonuclease [Halorhabdus utahensis DSM 12940]